MNLSIFYFSLQIETSGNCKILFKTHPSIDRKIFNDENLLVLKKPGQPFHTGQGGDGVCLLKWRMQRAEGSKAVEVPLTSKVLGCLVFKYICLSH